MAQNEWWSFLRSGKRYKDRLRLACAVFPAEMDSSADPEKLFDRANKTRAIEGALTTLPRIDQIIIEKWRFDNQTFRQIAKEIGAPESTVKGRFQRAIKQLAKTLSREFGL